MELKEKYTQAKQEAKNFMKSGNIKAYLQALISVNHYKMQLEAAV